MQEFLSEGHKVKVTLQFRGREMAHPELGSKILDAVLEQVGPAGKVETQARLEGRNMTMVIAPEKKVVPKKTAEAKAPAPEPEPAAAAPAAEATAPDAPASEAPVPEAATPEAAVADVVAIEPDPA
jgi:translation initiation factor IF-3